MGTRRQKEEIVWRYWLTFVTATKERKEREIINLVISQMERNGFFKTTSKKSIEEFIGSVREHAPRFGFRVHEVIDMGDLYNNYGIDVADDFKMCSITLCNPQESYKSITKNPERHAVILEQKQVAIYTKDRVTRINYMPLPKESVRQVFPDDTQFAESLHESCQKRIRIIKASK